MIFFFWLGYKRCLLSLAPLEQDSQNQLSSVGWSPTLYTLIAMVCEWTIINPISLFYNRIYVKLVTEAMICVRLSVLENLVGNLKSSFLQLFPH